VNILFTICGRAGSKGVKNKNIRDFCGVPISYLSLAAMQLYIDRYGENHTYTIVLNTDSDDLIRIVTSQQTVPVQVIRREALLGGDTVAKVSVIFDCLKRMEEAGFGPFDIVVDLDITSPLRTVEDIKNAIEKKVNRPDVDVVYSVTSARRNPFFNMVREEGDFFVKAIASNFTTRQEAPVFYDMNASIYAYSPHALRTKEHNTFFNDKASAIFMCDTGVLDIDSEEDYELIQVIAKYFFESCRSFEEIRSLAKDMYKSSKDSLWVL